MFGSKDKPQDTDTQDNSKAEKKGLFGWARRKDKPADAPAQADAPAPLSGEHS